MAAGGNYGFRFSVFSFQFSVKINKVGNKLIQDRARCAPSISLELWTFQGNIRGASGKIHLETEGLPQLLKNHRWHRRLACAHVGCAPRTIYGGQCPSHIFFHNLGVGLWPVRNYSERFLQGCRGRHGWRVRRALRRFQTVHYSSPTPLSPQRGERVGVRGGRLDVLAFES